MIQALVLIEGNVTKAALGISLSNALQIVIGKGPGFGWVVHIAANAPADLSKALIKFSQVPGVTGIKTLALQN